MLTKAEISTSVPPPVPPVDFKGVLSQELMTLSEGKLETTGDPIADAHAADLSGLAFSGGGIRSATFNLGVLQALASLGILEKFDYLSTVSGGGYIGSWLAAWIRRKIEEKEEKNIDSTEGVKRKSVEKEDPAPDCSHQGFKEVAEALKQSVGAFKPQTNGGPERSEPRPIAHLREFSNYLTPRKGLWGTDTWTLAVAYLRNFLLTLSVLVGALTAVILFVRAAAISYALMLTQGLWFPHRWIYWLLVISLSGTAFFAARDLQHCRTRSSGTDTKADCSKTASTCAVVGAVIAGWMGAAVLWRLHAAFAFDKNSIRVFLGAMAIVMLAGLLGRSFGKNTAEKKGLWRPINRIGAAAGAAIIFFLTLWALCQWFGHWHPASEWLRSAFWLAAMFAPALMLVAYALFAAVFVGLAGQDLEELEREWLARLLASVSKWTLLFSLLTIAVICAPIGLRWLAQELNAVPHKSILGLLWASISTAGAWLGQAGKEKETRSGAAPQKVLMAIAPPVFIAGLLLILIAGLDGLAKYIWDFSESTWNVWQLSVTGPRALKILIAAGIGVSLITLLWSWRVGVNTFSLHALYGNRLIRAYLGASNLKRQAHPFTRFAADDNKVRMRDLVPGRNQYRGPYLLVNAAINLVHTTRLAWQQRKAGAFLFSPLYCGYELPQDLAEERLPAPFGRGGYVPSHMYADGKRSNRGISLGKAMTISGAAASPNMGYRTSPALAFLMTVFNLRLGWWLPNTGVQNPENHQKPGLKSKSLAAMGERLGLTDIGRWRKTGPSLGLSCLMLELLGLTGSRRKYVYVSDGGHFENLGLYELVRRRCRHILVCDAEEDGRMTFGGLGLAVERCRTDFGIPIDIDVAQLRHDPATGRGRWHCAVGHIRYSQADPGQPDGLLLYLKASLIGDEPQDIDTYAASHTCFPHETTGDQWFDEMQFESYRALGHHITSAVLASASRVVQRNQFFWDPATEKKAFLKELFVELSKQWYPHNAGLEKAGADHDSLLSGLIETLRKDPLLAFLDWQLYSDLGRTVREAQLDHRPIPWVPVNYEELRAGFFFCRRLIQFMQQVYHDLDLDTYYAAPSHRGWMNLFQRWSFSRMLRYTWTMSAGCYSKRFQTFCAHHLRLEVGELFWAAQPLEVKVLDKGAAFLPLPEIERITNLLDQKLVDAAWRRAELEQGLDFFETQLAIGYMRQYCASFVKEDRRVPNLLKLYPLQITTEDPAQIQRDAYAVITVGFAIVRPEDGSTPEAALLYLRIRPAMRHMGLARKALKAMVAGKPAPALKVSEETIAKMTTATEHWHRRIYLELYPEQMQDASDTRLRMAEMVNHEIKKYSSTLRGLIDPGPDRSSSLQAE